MIALPIFSEEQVQRLVTMQDAIAAVERGLMLESAGQAETLAKHVLPYDNGQRALHLIGAVAPGLGISGVKTWVQHNATAHPVVLIFDSEQATPLALIQADVLSNLRTGALAGVASKYLAAPDADSLGVVGAGKQARNLINAVAAVRLLSDIRIWSPNPDSRAALAIEIRDKLGLKAIPVDGAREALDGARIVGLAARVNTPVVTTSMFAPGTHINSIGTTVSGRSELPLDAFPRFSRICTDSVASVKASSDEFRSVYRHDKNWSFLERLADIVSTAQRRLPSDDLTLYKGMGTGIADLALAALILQKTGLLAT